MNYVVRLHSMYYVFTFNHLWWIKLLFMKLGFTKYVVSITDTCIRYTIVRKPTSMLDTNQISHYSTITMGCCEFTATCMLMLLVKRKRLKIKIRSQFQKLLIRLKSSIKSEPAEIFTIQKEKSYYYVRKIRCSWSTSYQLKPRRRAKCNQCFSGSIVTFKMCVHNSKFFL